MLTLREFRHRAYPDRRRPARTHPHFATWALSVGIEGSDIPLGASVCLFMVPILAVASIFILRDINKAGKQILISTVNRRGRLDPQGQVRKHGPRPGLGLRWSYFFLVLFAIFTLTPPRRRILGGRRE